MYSMYGQAEAMGMDMAGIKKVKDFDEWLFEREGVWPKHEYSSTVLKKKGI